jgi:hypothetical protein
VGGVAAVVHGAPVNTLDLDIVHSTAPENIALLLAALQALDACYRYSSDRSLGPDESHLSTPGRQLLVTRFDLFDVLGPIGSGLRHINVLPHSPSANLGHALDVRVLDDETPIATKEQLAGEKGIAVLPILRRTLEESRRSSDTAVPDTTQQCG